MSTKPLAQYLARFFHKEVFDSPFASWGLAQQPRQSVKWLHSHDEFYSRSFISKRNTEGRGLGDGNTRLSCLPGTCHPTCQMGPQSNLHPLSALLWQWVLGCTRTASGVPTPAPRISGLWLFKPAFNSCQFKRQNVEGASSCSVSWCGHKDLMQEVGASAGPCREVSWFGGCLKDVRGPFRLVGEHEWKFWARNTQ